MFLPKRMGKMNLTNFRAAYNRIEVLAPDVFLPNLCLSLRLLWLSSNNILELPESITELAGIEHLQLDSNPLHSPPAGLLTEGLSAVQQYMRIRVERIAELHTLICDAGFACDLDALTPVTCNAITSETGYLSRNDLRDIDKAFGQYINEDFYHYSPTAKELVRRVLELRETREQELYQLLIAELFKRIEAHEDRDVFSDRVFKRHVTRPWGRLNESVGCFAITLDAVLKNCPSNTFVKAWRECFWDEAKKNLPRSIFVYSKEMLKKALVDTRAAYGKVACFEDEVYDGCECINWKDGTEIRHPAGECVVKSLVIVKIMYTREEGQRRNAEEQEIFDAFLDILGQVRRFMASNHGTTQLLDELKKRKMMYGVGIGESDIKIRQATIVLKSKMDLLKFAEQRKQQFEDGEPKHYHNLSSAAEAVELVDKAKQAIKDQENTIKDQMKKKQMLLIKKDKTPTPILTEEAMKNLVEKYCFIVYNEIQLKRRQQAIKYGWRRPWDGLDGEAFVTWASSRGLRAAGRHEIPSNKIKYEAMIDPDEEDELFGCNDDRELK
ncbi:unnamed protein product [Chrysoparadoxa australica]